ncbi:hypothetical protein [Roseovarius sp. A-2]|nr:hypothetical protein [Roseovarius sp. A-2]
MRDAAATAIGADLPSDPDANVQEIACGRKVCVRALENADATTSPV